jgi:anion-transporting  ArsA/GET3 family ATPase
MPEWTASKVAQTSTPEILQVEWEAGSPWATGDALVGDYCDVMVDVAGTARLSGRWRCVQLMIDPETDRVVVDLAPVDVTVEALT